MPQHEGRTPGAPLSYIPVLRMSAELAALEEPHPVADEAVFASAWGLLFPLDFDACLVLGRMDSHGEGRFTSNIAGAFAVLDHLLPGAIWKLGNDGGPNAEVMDPATGHSWTAVGCTPAAALLSAAFRVAGRNRGETDTLKTEESPS
ncbi:hypothetical protein LAZ40_04810 [Cereibacter sphaeroides]|uniref:hypothetical protein n=1 Tax=Cereibacter sphaeroides TaxID=1063 RepID=UPI001F375C61|nr:hypothetical protein [Cereibacter sphaeroides]MCE6958377.1 hypothetical protein [Cereibacter sphaeroides]MCE6972244.1 hypothetical protein [Cereibacter sphaeroides]